MTTYVRLPTGKMWHILGRRYQYDTFTVCDRHIPEGMRTTGFEPAKEETCYNCLTNTPWEELAPERAYSGMYELLSGPQRILTSRMLSLAETLRHLNDAGATYVPPQRTGDGEERTPAKIASSGEIDEQTQRAVRHYWPILRSHTDLIGTSPEDAGLVTTPCEWPEDERAVCGYERHRSAWRGGHCALCHPTATTKAPATLQTRTKKTA